MSQECMNYNYNYNYTTLKEIHERQNKLYKWLKDQDDISAYLWVSVYKRILSSYLITFYLTSSASGFLLIAWLNHQH